MSNNGNSGAKDMVPLVDLSFVHDPIRAELSAAFERVVSRRVFSADSPPWRMIIGSIARKPTLLRNKTISSTGKSTVSAFTSADPSVKVAEAAST